MCCLKSLRFLAAAGPLLFLFIPTSVEAASLQRAQSLPTAITEDPHSQPILDPSAARRVLDVSVIEENEHSLRLALKLEFLDGYDLIVEAIGADGVPVLAVPATRVAVDEPEARLLVSLEVPPGPEVEESSSYLRLVARRQEQDNDFLRLYFVHAKKWAAPPPVVRPEPIGEAIALVRRLQAEREEPGQELEERPEAQVEEQAEAQATEAAEEEVRDERSPREEIVAGERRPSIGILRPQVEATVEPRHAGVPEISLEERKRRELRPGIAVSEAIRRQLLETAEPADQPEATQPRAAILPMSARIDIDTRDLRTLSEPVLERGDIGVLEAQAAASGSQAAGSEGRFVRSDQVVLPDEQTAELDRAKYLVTLNKDVLADLPLRDLRLRDVPQHVFPLPQPEKEELPNSTEPTYLVEASGPALFGLVGSEPEADVDLHRVLGIEPAILPDRNAASGIYYYIPSSYRLAFDRDLGGSRGLALRIDYDRVTAPGADEKAVRVAMTLKAPLDGNGLAIVSKLMQAYAQRQPDVRFVELRPLPLASVPQFEFAANLAGMVAPEDIAVTAFSDFLEGLVVTWRTDPVRAERIRRDLASELSGITGTARFPLPSEDGQLVREIPAQVRLSDPEVFEAVRFDWSGALENVSPLPVRLKYLHALVLGATGGPRIYTWSLLDAKIPAGGEATIDLTNFPSDLAAIADRIWIDYGLDPACDDCLGPVVDDTLDGGLWPDTETVEIEALPSLFEDDAEIAEVEVLMRSRFFEPGDRSVREAPPFYLTPEETSHSIGPLFPDDSASAPLYEYLLSVRYASGEFLDGQNWIAQDRARLRPGRFQRQQSLGNGEADD